MDRLDGILNKSLGAIAAVVLIAGAGGGFKEMLIATKISDLIGQWATQAHISPLLLGWGAAAESESPPARPPSRPSPARESWLRSSWQIPL